MFVLQCDGIFSVNRAGEKAKQQTELFTGDIAAVSRDGYESFMEKEIAQQPQVTAQLVRRHLGANGGPDFSADGIADAFFDGLDGIELVGCGSATHAALLGRVWLESLAGIQHSPLAFFWVSGAPVQPLAPAHRFFGRG